VTDSLNDREDWSRDDWSMANCSIARTLEVIGTRSAFLLLREASHDVPAADIQVQAGPGAIPATDERPAASRGG